jgi:hypothetical protein
MTHLSLRWMLRVLPLCLLCASAASCKPTGDKISGPGSTSEIHQAASSPAASN